MSTIDQKSDTHTPLIIDAGDDCTGDTEYDSRYDEDSSVEDEEAGCDCMGVNRECCGGILDDFDLSLLDIYHFEDIRYCPFGIWKRIRDEMVASYHIDDDDDEDFEVNERLKISNMKKRLYEIKNIQIEEQEKKRRTSIDHNEIIYDKLGRIDIRGEKLQAWANR